MFPITWNVIAMEAAACYVGECRNGPRDAKIALTAEGVYGMFIYILTPLVFVGVLGAALTTSDPLTLYTDFTERAVRPRLVDQVVHRPAADPRAARCRC